MSKDRPGKAPQTALTQKKCVVAYADSARQYLCPVVLSAEATIADAIAAARRLEQHAEIPWDSAPVGIFGAPCSRTDVPAEGDRIELYRPLPDDPKVRRRTQSVRQQKAKKY